MNNKIVYLTVKLEYDDTFDLSEIVENMDYNFVYEDAIQLTEIIDVKDQTDYSNYGYSGNTSVDNNLFNNGGVKCSTV